MTTQQKNRIHNATESELLKRLFPRGINPYTPRGLSDAFQKGEIEALLTHPDRYTWGLTLQGLVDNAMEVMIAECLAE